MSTNDIRYISHPQASQAIGTYHRPRVARETPQLHGLLSLPERFSPGSKYARSRQPGQRRKQHSEPPQICRITIHNNGLRIFIINEATIGGKAASHLHAETRDGPVIVRLASSRPEIDSQRELILGKYPQFETCKETCGFSSR
jgi:hypothetical protein